MTALAAATGTDPVEQITILVCTADPGMDREAARTAIAIAAGGKARRSRLAAQLAARPGILTDGRPPASRAAGELLLALRAAGATAIAAPRCGGCGRELRQLSSNGSRWRCTRCLALERRHACAGCGQVSPLASRDRHDRPRCRNCPDHNSRDQAETLTGLITTIDPALPAQAVLDAIRTAAPGAAAQRHLAWAIQEAPHLLTGDGARAPVPSVLRLISLLHNAGSEVITRPACPQCGQVRELRHRHDGQRICDACRRLLNAEPCRRCGQRRLPAGRDDEGRPYCSVCYGRDPANHEPCARCGRQRRVAVRTPDGPLCGTCRPRPVTACSICGRQARCETSRLTGRPWCGACKQRRARCAGCGQVRLVRSGTLDVPLCGPCTAPGSAARPRSSCPGCGETRLQSGPCGRCGLGQRLHDLLSGPGGLIQPELEQLRQMLAAAPRPKPVLAWLTRSPAAAVLADIADGRRPLTHQALDELPRSGHLDHLRRLLVSAGALPARDEYLTRFEQHAADTIAAHDDPARRQLLHRYAIWHLLRRMRRASSRQPLTYRQLDDARQRLYGAIAFLDWLTARGLTISTCGQADLDIWRSSPAVPHKKDARHFVRWAADHRQAGTLTYPCGPRWNGPADPTDGEQRWTDARRLLHDHALPPADRIAGLLLLLYAQRPAAITRLTVSHLDTSGSQMSIRLGAEPLILPEPIASIIRTHISGLHHSPVEVSRAGPAWLFPGRHRTGQPITPATLSQRLRAIGIRPRTDRSAALFQLAAEIPAAILARLLGISTYSAVAWQRTTSGDWNAYAADISRRRLSAPPVQEPAIPPSS